MGLRNFLGVDDRGFGEAAVVFDEEAKQQLLFLAAERVEINRVGGVGKTLDLALDEIIDAVGRDGRYLALQLDGVAPNLALGIRVAYDDNQRQRQAEEAEAPEEETPADAAAAQGRAEKVPPLF
jgi:hypothetical protein